MITKSTASDYREPFPSKPDPQAEAKPIRPGDKIITDFPGDRIDTELKNLGDYDKPPTTSSAYQNGAPQGSFVQKQLHQMMAGATPKSSGKAGNEAASVPQGALQEAKKEVGFFDSIIGSFKNGGLGKVAKFIGGIELGAAALRLLGTILRPRQY
jgi:hypothetical protein